MFDWVIDGIRMIFWLMYAGMNAIISEIYWAMTSLPNVLTNVMKNETVISLFNSARNLFLIFIGLMIVVFATSRLFDWNINKLWNQMKKIFILCLILMSLPWIFTQFEKVTNSFISSANNAMVSEDVEEEKIDFGRDLANIYLYKNKAYEDSEEYKTVEDDPFENIADITNNDIVNKKIKNQKNKKVYIYSYLNPILGIILNLAIICLMLLTTFKVYGYLYNIVVLKIWAPIKLIKYGFEDGAIGDIFAEITSAFLSFGIQLILIPFTTVLLHVFTSSFSDNIFLNLVSVFVALWFMFTGVEYIQTTFQSKSGVPTVLQAYATSRMVKDMVDTASNVFNKNDSNLDKDKFDDGTSSGGELINTGRENDINADNENDVNNNAGESEEEGITGANPNEYDQNNETQNIDTGETDTDGQTGDEDTSEVHEDEAGNQSENKITNEDDVDNHNDNNTEIDEVDNGNEIQENEGEEISSNADVDSDEHLSGEFEDSENVNSNDNKTDNIGLEDNDVNNNDIENDMENDEPKDINETGESMENQKVEHDESKNNEINNASDRSQNIGENSEEKPVVGTSSNKGVENNSNSKSIPDELKPTAKQLAIAQANGINTEGRNKYELGNDIQDHFKSNNLNSDNKNNNPIFNKVDTPNETAEEARAKVNELDRMLNIERDENGEVIK